jgi:hypothetical protein
MATGYTESVSIDEGVENGVRTQLHFESSGDIVVQNTIDAEVHLDHAARARASTAGQKWGEGKFVCHIPDVFLAPILAIRDRKEREAAVMKFARENQGLVMFDRYLL